MVESPVFTACFCRVGASAVAPRLPSSRLLRSFACAALSFYMVRSLFAEAYARLARVSFYECVPVHLCVCVCFTFLD